MKYGKEVWWCAGLGILLLIMDPATALKGATEGIGLCIGSVIPALFPFFVLSMVLTSRLTGRKLPLLRPIGRLCGIPAGAEGLFLLGLLGGYPTGAQSIRQAYKEGSISQRSAGRLLGFCSNAGPSFLFGILGVKFSAPWAVWGLWAVQIVSAVAVGILLPGKANEEAGQIKERPLSMPQALDRSIRVTARVCGWVMLFRVALSFLDRWVLWLFPLEGQVTILGLMELTNGCCELEYVQNEALRFIIASMILSFGGICVLLQTISVTEELGLGLYIPGKILQACISTLLSCILAFLFYPSLIQQANAPLWLAGSVLLGGIQMILLKKKKIPSSIPAPVGV